MTCVSSFIGKLLGLLFLAVLLYALLYAAFPDIYQRMVFESPSGPARAEEAGEQIARTIEELEYSLEETGIEQEEARRIIEQTDGDTLTQLMQEEKGIKTAEQFFDTLSERIAFGNIPVDAVRDTFVQRAREIDFRKIADAVVEKGTAASGEFLQQRMDTIQ